MVWDEDVIRYEGVPLGESDIKLGLGDVIHGVYGEMEWHGVLI